MISFNTYEAFSFSIDDCDHGYWNCHALLLDECKGYYRMIVDTHKNTLEFLCGNIGYHWIFFTNLGVGTILGSYNCIEYNHEKLVDILSNHDALSIAHALYEIDIQINLQKKVAELPF